MVYDLDSCSYIFSYNTVTAYLSAFFVSDVYKYLSVGYNTALDPAEDSLQSIAFPQKTIADFDINISRSCIAQIGSTLITKVGNVVTLVFSNLTDYNTYKSDYDAILLDPNISSYLADNTNILYYKELYVWAKIAGSCGDVGLSKSLSVHLSSSFVFDDGSQTVTITLASITNGITEVTCDETYSKAQVIVNETSNTIAMADFSSSTNVMYTPNFGYRSLYAYPVTTTEGSTAGNIFVPEVSVGTLDIMECGWCYSSIYHEFTVYKSAVIVKITDLLSAEDNYEMYSAVDSNGCAITNPDDYILLKKVVGGVEITTTTTTTIP
jgi:hypothetical protein